MLGYNILIKIIIISHRFGHKIFTFSAKFITMYHLGNAADYEKN